MHPEPDLFTTEHLLNEAGELPSFRFRVLCPMSDRSISGRSMIPNTLTTRALAVYGELLFIREMD